MDRKTILKKERILSRISYKQYRELLSFVEEFYLADYSLKILVARKGSNLFSALIDLVREEDGGRVRQLYQEKFNGRRKPVIISNRALDFYAEEIKNGSFETILICDDTIRHGRVIFRLYEKVDELLSEHTGNHKIDLCAFAACKEDMPKLDCIQAENIKHYVNLGEYRVISDMVIDILSLAGQPYTSYIPNITIQKESMLYQRFINAITSTSEPYVDETEQKKLKLHAAIWLDSEAPEFAMFQNIRTYLYDDLEQCTLVPMVLPMPISEDTLSKYGEKLKDLMDQSYYEKVFSGCSELSYRTIIYVMSSLFLRQYIRKELHYEEALPELENAWEEKLNFGAQILNQEKMNQMSLVEIVQILEELNADYEKINPEEIVQIDSDTKALLCEVAAQMPEEYLRQTETASLVKRFFSINGDWNDKIWEERFSRGDTAWKNSCDYPFLCLSNQLSIETDNMISFYKHILQANDYGRGSIIAKKKEKDGKIYYLPFLTAGERNYKYKQEKYFPVLYGLFEIERKAAEKGIDPQNKKAEFLEAELFKDYRKSELKQLSETDVTAQYKPVLLKDMWYYPNPEKLDQSISLADKIMQ